MNLQTIGAAIGSARNKGISLKPLRLTNVDSEDVTLLYSDDSGQIQELKYRTNENEDFVDWVDYDQTPLTIPVGGFVELMGDNSQMDTSGGGLYSFVMSGKMAASGNIMSLVYGASLDEDNTLIIPSDNFFSSDDGSVGLFTNCDLTKAPILPAIELTQNCYGYMFGGCVNLDTAPELPATELAFNCYTSMFYGCAGLTSASALPATTLAKSCYINMFSGCTSLTAAPVLPATTLAQSCYAGMFGGCTSLTIAPELPATTLAISCYEEMFSGCTSLTAAPVLPATILANYCYSNMFSGCTDLIAITCLATDVSATACTSAWVSNISASGTFTKAAAMSDWTTGDSGIPSGWTVQDA